MTVFEPRSSGVGSNLSADSATATSHPLSYAYTSPHLMNRELNEAEIVVVVVTFLLLLLRCCYVVVVVVT